MELALLSSLGKLFIIALGINLVPNVISIDGLHERLQCWSTNLKLEICPSIMTSLYVFGLDLLLVSLLNRATELIRRLNQLPNYPHQAPQVFQPHSLAPAKHHLTTRHQQEKQSGMGTPPSELAFPPSEPTLPFESSVLVIRRLSLSGVGSLTIGTNQLRAETYEAETHLLTMQLLHAPAGLSSAPRGVGFPPSVAMLPLESSVRLAWT